MVFAAQDKALVLYSRVQKLPDPGSRDLHTLQEWLDRPEGGDFFLQGREADTWNDEDDVLTLSRRQADRDSVTGIVNDLIIPWYHCLRCRWNKVPLSSQNISQRETETHDFQRARER